MPATAKGSGSSRATDHAIPDGCPGRSEWIVALVAAALFTGAFLFIWPTEWIYDDGAIVLRYLDQAAAGGFYQYNLADPPVFGISGFIHGLLTNGLAHFHVLSPRNALLASNVLGVFLVAGSLLLILRRASGHWFLVLPAWLLGLVAAHNFITTALQGLEAPLHLGIILLAFLALISDWRRTFWFLAALAIISKLDAGPVVAVFVLARLLSRLSGERRWARVGRELLAGLKWSGIPLAVFVGVTLLLFGSPLPQTAFAKYMYHGHPENPLAFALHWWRVDSGLILMLGLPALLVALGLVIRRLTAPVSSGQILALLLACALLLAVFCLYNPQEKMPWYYVLPQFLVVVAGLAALLQLPRLFPASVQKPVAGAVLLGLLALAYVQVPQTLQESRDALFFIRHTEPERAAVGRFIHEHAAADDRLYAGFGYIVREAGIYAIDSSGLNSPAVTDLRRVKGNPEAEFKPEWLVSLGLWGPDFQRDHGYEFRPASSDDPVTGGHPGGCTASGRRGRRE